MARRNRETKKEWLAKEVTNTKRRLNTKFLKEMTPDLLSDIDANNEARTCLEALQDSNR